MTLAEKNLAALRERYPEYADVLSAVPEASSYSFERGEHSVLCRDASGKWLHGPDDPLAAARAEADRVVQEQPELYVLLRPGLGYLALALDEAIERRCADSLLLVVEDRLDLVKSALALVDWGCLLGSPRTMLLLGRPDVVIDAGARAGLGPDGVTGSAHDGAGTADVATRPDPRLDRPIASRLADDISESAQMAQAERMGVHVPVEARALSRAGAMAGLAPLGPNSSSRKAKALASSSDLAMSVSKVRMAAQKTTAMQSRPVPGLSDASGRRGITGKDPIAASGRGFEKKVPMSPRAQDRERWASGTSDRIAGASKGLNLANMDWGDHRGAPPKAQPKRTWVGKQGDATECPDNCTAACGDLAVQPHSAVNKSAPFRELEKETAPSDDCPVVQKACMPSALESFGRDKIRRCFLGISADGTAICRATLGSCSGTDSSTCKCKSTAERRTLIPSTASSTRMFEQSAVLQVRSGIATISARADNRMTVPPSAMATDFVRPNQSTAHAGIFGTSIFSGAELEEPGRVLGASAGRQATVPHAPANQVSRIVPHATLLRSLSFQVPVGVASAVRFRSTRFVDGASIVRDFTVNESPPLVLDDRASLWNKAFERPEGWRLADGGISVPISGNRTLWIWGDTWTTDDTKRAHLILGGTIAVSGIQPPPVSPVAFFARSIAGETIDITKGADVAKTEEVPFDTQDTHGAWAVTGHENDPRATRVWLWPVTAVEIDNVLYFFHTLIHCPPDTPQCLKDDNCCKGYDVDFRGEWRITKVENPGSSPENWVVSHSEFQASTNRLSWQQFYYDRNSSPPMVYIFGIESPSERLCLARATPTNFSSYNLWEFWQADGTWAHDDRPDNLRTLTTRVWGNFSINSIEINGSRRFLLAHTYWDPKTGNYGLLANTRGVIRVSDDETFYSIPEDESRWYIFDIDRYEVEFAAENPKLYTGDGPAPNRGFVRDFKAHPNLSTLPWLLVGYSIFGGDIQFSYNNPFCGDIVAGRNPGPCGAERFAVVDLREFKSTKLSIASCPGCEFFPSPVAKLPKPDPTLLGLVGTAAPTSLIVGSRIASAVV